MRQSGSVGRHVSFLLAALASANGLAAEITVQNDSLDNGSTAVVQAGFVSQEQAAAWLTTPCTGNIVALQVMWLSLTGGTPDSLEDSITVYEAGTFPTPGLKLDEVLGPVMVDGYLNEFRYKDQLQTVPISIPVTAGQTFVVAFRFENDPNPGNGPSVVTDSNGCQAGRNGLFAIPPTAWLNACALGLSGDFVIRAVVSGPTCTSSQTGACCNPDTTCTPNVTQAQCSAGGGTYQGNGSTCTGTNCPPPQNGACCLAGGACTDGTAAQCSAAGGVFQGVGTTCATTNCPQQTGACCLASGACTDVTSAACATAGGVFQGVGTTCSTTSCPQPTDMDMVVGRGLGQPNANEVKGFTSAGGATAVRFNAYGAGAWGVNVAAGNVDGGASDEILTGPGPGDVFGPQVRAFQAGGAPMGKINFYAYGTLKYGVNVAGSDPEADAFDEILTGPGPGQVFGPHVRGWNFDAASVTAISKINFFAYSTLKFGVNVASGDVENDGLDELLTGPGPGAIFGPQVRGFNYDGGTLQSIAKINFNAFSILQWGVNLAGGSVDADAFAEIACTPGPGPGASWPAEFVGFDYGGTSITPLAGFVTSPYGTWTYGGRVGLGDVSADGPWDLLTGPGRDPAASSNVKTFRYAGGALTALPADFEAFAGATYGVNVAGGSLGY